MIVQSLSSMQTVWIQYYTIFLHIFALSCSHSIKFRQPWSNAHRRADVCMFIKTQCQSPAAILPHPRSLQAWRVPLQRMWNDKKTNKPTKLFFVTNNISLIINIYRLPTGHSTVLRAMPAIWVRDLKGNARGLSYGCSWRLRLICRHAIEIKMDQSSFGRVRLVWRNCCF